VAKAPIKKGKTGRPRKELSPKQLVALMRLNPTLEDTAAFFSVSPDTIERRIRDDFDVTFAEFRDQNMADTRFALVRKALSMAKKGDRAMLIFCLKALCGWKETTKHEVTGKDGEPLMPKGALPTAAEAAAILAGDYATQPATAGKVEEL
jgi:AraC-like DNA-binding protein